VQHAVACDGKVVGVEQAERVEQRSMLAVLPLQLPVELRMTGRAVEQQNAIVAKHLANFVGLMGARTVGPPDQRRAVLLEVVLDSVGHVRAIVVLRRGGAGAVLHRTVAREEKDPRAPRGRKVELIEASHDARLGDGDPLGAEGVGFAPGDTPRWQVYDRFDQPLSDGNPWAVLAATPVTSDGKLNANSTSGTIQMWSTSFFQNRSVHF
jgi:hypothetical protein